MSRTESSSRRPDIAIATVLAVILVVLAVLAASSQGAPPTGSADLSITKTDAKDSVQSGAPIDYTITVTNLGPDTAVTTVVTDKLPKGTTFVSGIVSGTSVAGTCTAKGAKVTCTLGDLTKSGAHDTATISLRVTAPTTGGTITNTADVTSDTPDPNKANNSATQTTEVAGGGGGGAPSCLGSKATIVGTSASETLRGTNGRDVIFGSGGADQINGLGGKDLICGAAGSDRLKGGDANDRVSGGGGRDRIGGQAGNDVLKGGKRADVLRGGPGNDLLVGGKGNDRCSGGPGKDVERSC